jgi:hypothetical protein
MADPSYIVDGVLVDGEAWVGIGSTTLTSDTASITFTSTDDGQVGDFSQYMDLVAILYWRSAHAATHTQPHIDINGSSSDFKGQLFWGTGSAAVAETTVENRFGFLLIADTNTTNAFQASVVQFSDINSGKYKSFVAQNALNAGAAGYVDIAAVTWQQQAAITSISFKGDSGDLLDESRIDLFGILPRMVTA